MGNKQPLIDYLRRYNNEEMNEAIERKAKDEKSLQEVTSNEVIIPRQNKSFHSCTYLNFHKNDLIVELPGGVLMKEETNTKEESILWETDLNERNDGDVIVKPSKDFQSIG